jgi:hypothetical protein
MEILRFENAPVRKTRKKSSNKTLLGLSAIAAVAVFGSTLAANISLNGGTVEFGQGVSQTTACDSDGITVTPKTEFANVSNGGEFKFKSIDFAGVASACTGKIFKISAFGDSSSTAVDLISGVSTATIAWSSTASARTASANMTLAKAATSAETLTFTTPTATAGSIYKLTIQSE